MRNTQNLFKSNKIHYTSAVARTKVYREVKHFSEWVVPGISRYQESEQDNDTEVGPA